MAIWMVKQHDLILTDPNTKPEADVLVLAFTHGIFVLVTYEVGDDTWNVDNGDFYRASDADSWWDLPDTQFPVI